MTNITTTAYYAIDLYDKSGDSVTVQPGTCKVEDRFTVNLPPQVIKKEDK
jgi:hypothetical protein